MRSTPDPDPRPPADEPWHTLDADEVSRRLNTAPSGLPGEEAARRLERYGPNEIERERETPWWLLLLHQFTDPLIYILLVAAGLTLLLQDYSDTGVILAAVLLNAVIGFTQERRAQKEMRALQTLTAPHAEAVRDGDARELPSRELVPGDVVVLATGSRVPADLRLFRTQGLAVDESALTGESLPVTKSVEALADEGAVPGDRINMAFAGTVVTRGRGWGYVVQTGATTELGRIATAVREAETTKAPLQLKMIRFGKQIAIAVLVLSVLVSMIGLLRGLAPREVLFVGIALIVSAIPESLPVVLTVTFAVGVRRMAQRKALIRALPAVETLGSATLIGSDKTGTLTKNEMTVERIWAGGREYRVTGSGYDADGQIFADDGGDHTVGGGSRSGDGGESARHEGAVRGAGPVRDDEPVRHEGQAPPTGPLFTTLLAGALANEADPAFLVGARAVGNPTELALLAAAAKGGLDPVRLQRECAELDILPFEPERRLMATLNELPDGRTIFLKGAPEAVLALCDCRLDDEGSAPIDPDEVRDAASALAGHGLRVLAMAFKRCSAGRIEDHALSNGFTLAGLQGMRDPVRPEAVDAVRDAKTAGIRVIMLTGDHAETAAAVGRELGLDPHGAGAAEGHRIDDLSDAELDDVVARFDIFARVAPEHKLRIVERHKARGEVVAVTGDGVNDAPALRAAHLGIAMGASGTDVAREASDIVLADDNFATITAAVEEGRVVFSNVRKVTYFLLSTTAGDILAILAALLLGWPIPFTAAQILWVNLVTNGVQDLALAVEPPERGLLERPPRPRDEGVITARHLLRFMAIGAILAAGVLLTFRWTLDATDDLTLARTAAMTQIVVFNFYHVVNCRSLDASITKIPFFSNPFLFFSILGAVAAQLAVIHLPVLQRIFSTAPLSAAQWGVMLLIGTTVIIGAEVDKWVNRRRGKGLG